MLFPADLRELGIEAKEDRAVVLGVVSDMFEAHGTKVAPGAIVSRPGCPNTNATPATTSCHRHPM
jgi:hypothetical protein